MGCLPIVFSGIQPSGAIHLGNYLGAIMNWIGLQSDDNLKGNNCFFCVVDLHAITAKFYHEKELKNNTISAIATYVACGIDPNKSVIFPQSAVPGHSELCWLLSCCTPMGWLNRMTQFKEKSSDKKQAASLGLYSYPVLMAADILLYKTKYVPVGDDQKQHLELAREIAGSFNNIFSTNYFNLPEPLIFENVARIMSLRDGTKKMSKSEESDSSRINLIDEDEIIVQKIKKAKTDSVLGFDFHNIKERPEVHNLVSIYSALKNISVLEACLELENLLGMDQFKKNLADLIIAKFAPIRKCYNRLITDEMHYLTQIAKSGAEKANSIAQKTVLEVKEIMGFLV